MYKSRETADILFVTERTLDAERASDRVGLDLGVATVGTDLEELSALLRESPARGVLIGSDVDHDRRLEIVRLLADRDTLPPGVVFAPEASTAQVEQLLREGAADVVHATMEDTAPALLERRIDGLGADADVGPEAAQLSALSDRLFDTIGDAIYRVSLDGRLVQVNEAATDLTGYSREELVGTHVSEFVTRETLAETASIREEQLAGDVDDDVTMELTIETRDGDRVPCEARINAIRDDGEITGWVGVARDLRAQEQRKAELARTRELLANAERLGDVGVWEVDLETESLFWSDGARRIRDVGPEFEPMVDDVLSFYHPEDRDRITDLVETCAETGEPFSTQARIITEDGDERWVHLQGEQIEADEPRDVRGYIQDVTEQIEREQELQAERDLVEQVLELSPVGIVTIDPGGRIVHANEQASSILGLPVDELVGSTYDLDRVGIRTPDGEDLDPAEFPAARILEEGEETRNEEFVIQRSDGTDRIISVDGVPLYEDGEIHRAILTIDDVTEDVERESRLTEQRNELAQLDHINRIIRGVDQALLAATSRGEILDAVCQQLSGSNRYRFAIAVSSLGDGNFELHSWDGPTGSFLDEAFPVDRRLPDSDPVRRAAETDEKQVLGDLTAPEEFADAPWQRAAVEAGVRSVVALPISYEGQVYGVITVYAPFANFFSSRELAVLDELRGTVGYAIAAVERREREQILTSLYETTQDLLAATTERAVTDTVVDAASEVLDAPGVGIALFDDEENVLEVTSTTDDLLEFYGGVTRFGPGHADSATWQAYLTGEPTFYRDIRESDHVVNPDTAARSTLLLPLGEHGVFVVCSDQRGGFGEKKRQLIGLLAATTEAALDRVAGRAGIEERDRELAARAERVERLESHLDLLLGVDATVPQARTRAEIESDICSQLTGRDGYAFAWIGHLPPGEDAVDPQSWAGAEEGYLDDVTLEFGAQEPVARAAVEGDVVAVQDVTDRVQGADWARSAVNREIQSVLAVPLEYGETTYGVLGVYATEPGAFDAVARNVLRQVAETTAYAIRMVETSQGLLGEQLTELELAVPDPDTFLNAVSRVAGEPVTYRKITPQPDGSARVLFTLSTADVEEVLALEDEFVAVDSLTAVERGGEHLLRASLSGRTVAATLLDCGAIPREVVATPGETTATVRLSREVDVRVFIDRVAQQFPDTELRSRRSVDATASSPEDVWAVIDEELTDRQREVLLTAYESGFFESPRDTTGEQLAELLDLSQPTVTHHLREAQRRLYRALLDDA